jgi:hypothetical protein
MYIIASFEALLVFSGTLRNPFLSGSCLHNIAICHFERGLSFEGPQEVYS